MAVVRQNSFGGGMMSRSLEGRDDVEKRRQGARRIENFIVTPYGSLRKRPGFTSVPTFSLPAHPGHGSRLVGFRSTSSSHYLLLFTNFNLHVLFNGTVIRELGSPWSGLDIMPDPNDPAKPGIKWVQDLDKLLVTHPNYEPRVITRRAHRDWRIDALVPEAVLAPPKQLVLSVAD